MTIEPQPFASLRSRRISRHRSAGSGPWLSSRRTICESLPDVAALRVLSTPDLRQLRLQLIAYASAALFVLMATALSIYKPWGMTSYGIPKEDEGTSRRARVLSDDAAAPFHHGV